MAARATRLFSGGSHLLRGSVRLTGKCLGDGLKLGLASLTLIDQGRGEVASPAPRHSTHRLLVGHALLLDAPDDRDATCIGCRHPPRGQTDQVSRQAQRVGAPVLFFLMQIDNLLATLQGHRPAQPMFGHDYRVASHRGGGLCDFEFVLRQPVRINEVIDVFSSCMKF